MLSGPGPWGKSKCHSDTREPRPHNRISVTIYLNIGLMVCDMFPTPQPQNWQFMSPVHEVTMLHSRSSSLLAQLVERSAFRQLLNEDHRNVRGSSPLRGASFSWYFIDTQFLHFLLSFFRQAVFGSIVAKWKKGEASNSDG